ncbi:hypothetical protein [Streptomyces canus]|uniref:hypothetical protein n=1 Tax=Streptomyces canus TaxID=58343 RepID=UPI002DD7F066|nr:hypothetical protein [Streptomyces canus]WSD82838.1 hypothetical protein OG925_00015 [Streptomyces canus]WSD91996.1 hypothetical protein OG925_50465 [Streptomyces canus]WSD92513.1 hypothetical protein OG925_50490 [Streptomyces canus]
MAQAWPRYANWALQIRPGGCRESGGDGRGVAWTARQRTPAVWQALAALGLDWAAS